MAEKDTKKMKSSGPSGVSKLYLIAYNSILSVGWAYMLLQSVAYFLNRGTLDSFWTEIKWTVIIVQNAAVLEIIHSIIRLVPSGVMVVLPQVFSRVFVVCGCMMATQTGSVSPGLPLCILAWSITEIIRYAYYALNLLNCVPPTLLFLRYSTFLILYPTGITGELMCLYHSLDEMFEKQLFTVSMPNAWNFIFNYYYFVIIYMFSYIPFFPYLFNHMLRQRRKMLGRDAKKTN